MSHISMLADDIVASATVPFERCSSHLRGVLDQFGFAIVTGVLNDRELSELESWWVDDLRGIVDIHSAENKSGGE